MAQLEVTPALVRATAALAKIDLTDAEVPVLVAQLQRILEHISVLETLDAELPPEAPEAATPGPAGALREDTPGPCLARDVVLAQAPNAAEGLFVVPAFLDG
jgi:aspartyl-tRNA(Asn)/glutamyl-tRNA(Gln) amidotransferase subunit C